MNHRMTIQGATAGRLTTISPSLVAPLYLIGIAGAEVVTNFVGVSWGGISHALLISAATALALRAATSGAEGLNERSDWRAHASMRFYVALILPSLVRLVTLAMPLDELAVTERAGVIAVPLVGASWAAARANGWRPQDLGLVIRGTWPGLLLDLCVAASGVAIGYAAFRLLRPAPLMDELTLGRTLAMSAAYIGIAAVVEAFIVWGVLHTAGRALFGPVTASIFVAVVVATLHTSGRSWKEMSVAFGVALALCAARSASRSLFGVLLAYGIANVFLFLIFPVLLRT